MDKKEILNRIKTVNKEKFSNLSANEVISVSKMLEYVTTPFDKEGQAKICEEKGRDNPDYKYAGMLAEEIIAMWDAKTNTSKMYGSLLDDYTEQFFAGDADDMEIWKMDHNFDSDVRLRENCKGFEQFVSDIKAYGFEYVGREITLYGEVENKTGDMPFDAEVSEKENGIVKGRLDCLFMNPATGKLLIVDWKTTDEIKTSGFGKMMKGPAYNFQDCDLSKYIIQVQTYKNDLIKTYKIGSPDSINVVICNLRKEPDPQTGRNYILYKENNAFNSSTLDEIVLFAIKKRKLLSKKNNKAIV